MLQALSVAAARAVAAAALRWSRDEKAMLDYLGIGRRGRGQRPRNAALLETADIAAFDSPERAHVEALLAALSPEARRELIALAFLARALDRDFAAAMRRARRIPAEAQIAYLLGRKLERAIPAGLEKLGHGP
jgi:hypothetical protein